jgi:hypothetical protein
MILVVGPVCPAGETARRRPCAAATVVAINAISASEQTTLEVRDTNVMNSPLMDQAA